MSRPLVLSRLDHGPGWLRQLGDARLATPDGIPDSLDEIDSVWIDAARARPLDVARRVGKRDAAVQTIVVAPPEDREIHERTLLFTPGLGEVWLASPDDVGPALRDRARELTGTRRGFRSGRERLQGALQAMEASRPTRAIVSDAYLAALLQVLPDLVVSVDEDGRILSWSDAGERLTGVGSGEAVGRVISEVVQPEDREAFAVALEDGRRGTVQVETCLHVGARKIFTQTLITPVEAGRTRVRALVLRDVTREREALNRLQRAVELRSRFYAAMSHEIRTPINTIMGYNELLRTGAGGPEKQADYLDRSQRAANHLLDLVNDVLDLSKLESGALDVSKEPVPVAQLLTDLVDTIEPLARERETPLRTECEREDAMLNTDPRRVRQILMNLVTNALKFGQSRPVVVRCGMDGEWVRFEVEDQGTGIAPEDQERIFEEFTQVAGTEGGTGLGLPISRKLAELLGGTLTLDSEPGRGSTFRLLLPVGELP